MGNNKKSINYDIIEKTLLKKWNMAVLVISLISLFLMVEFVSLKYSFVSIFIFSFLDYDRWRYFYLLGKIKCPSCEKVYFKPFFASKDDIKTLFKSNPKCVNCYYEAEIISEYKTMY